MSSLKRNREDREDDLHKDDDGIDDGAEEAILPHTKRMRMGNILEAKSPAPKWTGVLDLLFPGNSTTKPAALKELSKLATTQLKNRRHVHINGMVNKKGEKGMFIGTPLSEFLRQEISDMKNDEASKNLRAYLEYIVHTPDDDKNKNDGYASDTSISSETILGKLEDIKSLLGNIFDAISMVLPIVAVEKEAAIAPARGFVVYLISFFAQIKLSIEKRKDALLCLSNTTDITQNPWLEFLRVQSDDDVIYAFKNIPVLGQIVAGSVLQGDPKLIQQVGKQAAKQYVFMTQHLPNELVHRQFIQQAYHVTAGEEDRHNESSVDVLMKSFYLDLSVEQAKNVLAGIDAPAQAPIMSMDQKFTFEILKEWLQERFHCGDGYGPPPRAVALTKDAISKYPNIGFEKLLGSNEPTESMDTYTHKPLASRVFNATNVCKNTLMKRALLLSETKDCPDDLKTALAQESRGSPSTQLQKAGAGLLLVKQGFKVIDYLGSGSFCTVYKALYKGKLVALKILAVKAVNILKEVYRAFCCPALLGNDFVVRTLGYLILNAEELERKEIIEAGEVFHIAVVDELGGPTLHELQQGKQNTEKIPSISTSNPKILRKKLKPIMSARLDAYLQPLIELLEALDEAHKNGVEHRDFKPENVLLVGGRWKVADWGTAKKENTMNVGTQAYCPPEGTGRDPIYGPFTDLFSFGIVAYKMLVGIHPPEEVAKLGNPKWFDGAAQYVFTYPYLDDSTNNDKTIGASLQKLISGLTAYDYKDRWTTEKALLKLKEIVELHESEAS